jgi:hypothetical protein
MPLIPPVRVNDFYYKGIIEGYKPNQAALIYHNHSKCSAVNGTYNLLPYSVETAGESLRLCFDCERLAAQENGG